MTDPQPDQPYDQFPLDPAPQQVWVRDDQADRALANALRPWCYQSHIGGNQRAAAAAAKWLRARGL